MTKDQILADAFAARDKALTELNVARSALLQAAIWFRGYAAEHDAKGNTLKANTNHTRADACRHAALGFPKPDSLPAPSFGKNALAALVDGTGVVVPKEEAGYCIPHFTGYYPGDEP